MVSIRVGRDAYHGNRTAGGAGTFQKGQIMHRRVVFFEVEGGSDKGPDGHRKDTMPMVNALKAKGWDAEVIFYSDDRADEIFADVVARCDAYVPRVNPGSIPGGEATFFAMLRKLSDHGVVGMPHPDTMRNFGAKDALTKLADTDLVPDDTKAYYTTEALHKDFPVTLSIAERVLKQNRGSTGEGIWRVQIIDEREFTPGEALPLDTKIKCTEAVDNHSEERELGEFMTFCEQYINGAEGMLVDMRFCHRIVEGEIRVLYVGASPVFVVHKKPAAGGDAFSATLFSGAEYTYQPPSDYAELVQMFEDAMPTVSQRLGSGDTIPLIWTADFMLEDAPDGGDMYVLGEINCSCVGFTSHLDQGIQDLVADEVIRVLES